LVIPVGIGAVMVVGIPGPKVQVPTTSRSSARNITPTSTPTGTYCRNPWRSSAKSTSSIITTNRNSTATAPTYTTTRIIARNSAPSSTNNPAALTKARMRNSTECTGFLAAITITADATQMPANK
jgi:hypothetical protein